MREDNPKVSVIIPIYNVENYVEDCIVSVMKQTLKDIEIICIDDCSTDKSLEIVKKLKNFDSRIRLYQNDTNLGLSTSRNKGLSYALGKYVYFLDADDMIVPEALETLYIRALQLDLDILYFDTKQIFEIGITHKIGRYNEKHKFYTHEPMKGTEFLRKSIEARDWNSVVWRQFYKRDYIENKQLRFVDGILHEDYLFSLDVVLKADRVLCEPYQVHIYRRRENSLTTSMDLYIDKIWGMSVTYKKYQSYMIDYKGTSVYHCIAYLCRSIARNIVNLYKQIDTVDILDSENVEKLEIASILGTALYGGYFPYKLQPKVMEQIRSLQYVIIYGAGEVGKGLLELLNEREIKVECFAVTQLQDINNVMGHEVREINNLNEFHNSAIVLVAAMVGAEGMKDTAEKLGFKNILVVIR